MSVRMLKCLKVGELSLREKWNKEQVDIFQVSDSILRKHDTTSLAVLLFSFLSEWAGANTVQDFGHKFQMYTFFVVQTHLVSCSLLT